MKQRSLHCLLAAEPGFSLIELLGVLAVIGMAAAWILPSLPDFLRTYAHRSALDQVLSSLHLARTLAISRGTSHLWAVVPVQRGWPSEYPLRSFAVFRNEQSIPGDTPIWIQETPWHRFPDGVRFEPTDSGPFGRPQGTAPCPVTGANLEICGVEFTPSGSIHTGTELVQIQLTTARSATEAARARISHFHTIQIRPSTGMARLISR
jgi:prepilin-type N-terminal cleavage/methylation domain-containing protein